MNTKQTTCVWIQVDKSFWKSIRSMLIAMCLCLSVCLYLTRTQTETQIHQMRMNSPNLAASNCSSCKIYLLLPTLTVGFYYQRQGILRKLALRKNFQKSAEKERNHDSIILSSSNLPTSQITRLFKHDFLPTAEKKLSNASHNLIPQ